MFLLQARNLRKSFGGATALRLESLDIAPGEALGLIGENGAGKSTLIKILSGVFPPDEGGLLWEGQPARFASAGEALRCGIATIHQELAYFAQLSVAENIFMAESWPRLRWGGVDWAQLFEDARGLLDQFNLRIDPRAPFHLLSPAEKQEVAIVRALSKKAKLLILDEPTASLAAPEAARLFEHLKRLRQEKVALLYVSHRLEEILQLTDRVLVLRDGELVAAFPTREATADRLVKEMIGHSVEATRRVAHQYNSDHHDPAQAALQIRDLTAKGYFEGVTFDLHAGEVVGLAGLTGSGRAHLGRALYGLHPADSGTIHLRGILWQPGSPAKALREHIVYIPEERKKQGFVLDHSLQESILAGLSDLLQRWGLLRRVEVEERPRRVVEERRIKARDLRQPIGTLSGGNQQKALLGRWLEREPQILILNEPTRGVDVGAKAEIHQLILDLATAGKAVLLISSDLPELAALSHRVLVMAGGRLRQELGGESITQENILRSASGLAAANHEA